VHGITTYSFIWRRVTERLCREHEVFAVDLLGCGESSNPLDVEYSLNHHAQLLSTFVRELGLSRVHLVGHDIGGGVAQVIAVRRPENLRDVTLVNPVGYDFWPVQPIVTMRTPIVRQFALATLHLGTFRAIVRRGLFHPERATPELMKLFWEPMKTRQGRKAFLRFAESLDNRHLTDIVSALRELKLPVLVVRGDSDVYLSRAITDRLHDDIPHSRLVVIPEAGHFIQEDQPQALAEALLKFFRERHDAGV
jgi:pimeloyl-ACP methyl ester carboxylesterase